MSSRLVWMKSMVFSADEEPLHGSAPDADPHGQAALLLVESLIHGLTACSVLSVADAVSIMEVALDTQLAVIDDAARPTPSMRKVAALLSRLLVSLSIDLPREQLGTPPAPEGV